MAEVDPADEEIKSYLVRHHKYDPETKHFRWFVIKAYDNEAEMSKHLESLWKDLELRRLAGQAHPKEQIAGQICDPEWRENNQGWSSYTPLL